jgi:hypothetical protein
MAEAKDKAALADQAVGAPAFVMATLTKPFQAGAWVSADAAGGASTACHGQLWAAQTAIERGFSQMAADARSDWNAMPDLVWM